MENPSIQVDNKRTINAWAMFDWANSAFALVITTAIFPDYFNQIVDDQFDILGVTFTDSSLYSYSISFAYLLVVLMLPVLSGIADYGGRRMFFLRTFTILGSIGCVSLFFFTSMSTLWIGVIGFVIAMIGFAGGQVFYNSYLPLIASEKTYDSVSAQGFSYGFIGSVLLLIVNLLMVLKPELFGISDSSTAVQISFIMVGLWWIGWAQIPFNRLPQDPKIKPKGNLLGKGFQELRIVFNALQHQVFTKRFLVAFFLYSTGVQTLLYLATTFATDELGFETSEIIGVVIILQLLAVAGAYLFAYTSGKIGNKLSLIIMLVVWVLICVLAYIVTGKTYFYGIAALVGLVMGGIQSLSRSTYSKLLPVDVEDTASYFSFYDVTEKAAIVLGTFLFAFVDQLTGGMRNSILLLSVFFFTGMLVLYTVKVKPAEVK